jgi:hypothetical protein
MNFSTGMDTLSLTTSPSQAISVWGLVGQGLGATSTSLDFSAPADLPKVGIAFVAPRDITLTNYFASINALSGTTGSTYSVAFGLATAPPGSTSFVTMDGYEFMLVTPQTTFPTTWSKTMDYGSFGKVITAGTKILPIISITGIPMAAISQLSVTVHGTISYV